jgi:hypothetical protein
LWDRGLAWLDLLRLAADGPPNHWSIGGHRAFGVSARRSPIFDQAVTAVTALMGADDRDSSG